MAVCQCQAKGHRFVNIPDFHARINNDSKYSNYRLFKTTFEFENYLIKTPYF